MDDFSIHGDNLAAHLLVEIADLKTRQVFLEQKVDVLFLHSDPDGREKLNSLFAEQSKDFEPHRRKILERLCAQLKMSSREIDEFLKGLID